MKETPIGWRSGRVDDFLLLQRGFDLTEKDAQPEGVPVISSSGISYYHNEAKVDPPGIITGRKGRLGTVYLINVPFWPHDTTLWVKDFKGNNPSFVKLFLESLRLERLDAATSVPTLNRNNVHNLKASFPPLDEQKQIVAIIAQWDSMITLTKWLIAAKQRRKKALMQQLLTGQRRFRQFEGEEWREVHIEDVAEVVMGQSPDSAYYNEKGEGLYLIQGNADIKNGKTAPRIYTSQVTKRCKIDDIILSVRAPVGEVALSQHEACIGRGVCAIRAKKIDTGFLFQTLIFLDQKWNVYAQGSTFTAINSRDIKKFKFVIPVSVKEQRKIAAVLQACDDEIELLGQKLAALKRQKKGLMQKLLTGEVRAVV